MHFPLHLPGCLSLVLNSESWGNLGIALAPIHRENNTALRLQTRYARQRLDILSSSSVPRCPHLVSWLLSSSPAFRMPEGHHPVIHAGTEVSLQSRHTTGNIHHVFRGLLGGSENYQVFHDAHRICTGFEKVLTEGWNTERQDHHDLSDGGRAHLPGHNSLPAVGWETWWFGWRTKKNSMIHTWLLVFFEIGIWRGFHVAGGLAAQTTSRDRRRRAAPFLKPTPISPSPTAVEDRHVTVGSPSATGSKAHPSTRPTSAVLHTLQTVQRPSRPTGRTSQ